MKFSVFALVLIWSFPSSALAQTLRIDRDQFDAQPGESINLDFDGATYQFDVRTRTETAEHVDLFLEHGGTEYEYAGRLQLSRHDIVHLYLNGSGTIYEGPLTAAGVAELAPGSLVPFFFADPPCTAETDPPPSPSPMYSSGGGERFSLDTELVRTARICTIWELETPVGTLPFLISEVTKEAPAYLRVSGVIIGTEANDHYGRPQIASLTVNDPCNSRDEDVSFCWELILNGQVNEHLQIEDNLYITASPKRHGDRLEIIVRERPPPIIDLSNDVRWVADDAGKLILEENGDGVPIRER